MTLYREIAQPHVTDFREIFEAWDYYDVSNGGRNHKFEPRYITGQNVGGNLYKNCKRILQHGQEPVKHPDERMPVGPFCSLSDHSRSFSVRCADWVLSRIRERTIIIGDDRMSFEISLHANGWALVTAHHSCIIGSVWLAYIRQETIPQPQPEAA